MIDFEKQRENFKNHIAKLTDYGNIKILDFKNPDSNNYRIRFLFEEDYCRLHISGDLGHLIATNYNNMTYEKFSDFVNNTGYFEEKIDCIDRKIYVYDYEAAKKDLKELIDEHDLEEQLLENTYKDTIDDVIDEILNDFDSDKGIGSGGYDIIDNVLIDAWEYVGDIGKQPTGILYLYMLAFKLAKEQLN